MLYQAKHVPQQKMPMACFDWQPCLPGQKRGIKIEMKTEMKTDIKNQPV